MGNWPEIVPHICIMEDVGKYIFRLEREREVVGSREGDKCHRVTVP